MPNRRHAFKTRLSVHAGVVMRCFVACILLCTPLPVAAMTQQGNEEVETQQAQPPQQPRQAQQPLNVPVYPRFKPENRPVDIEGLRDSYIVLEDGAVLSLADWVLGSLRKSETGVGMSDYQNRLFLGQVARAAVGMKQDLIYRSYRDAGPLRSFVPHRPSQPAQVAQGFLSYFVPAFRPNWTSETSGKPTLGKDLDQGLYNSIHFDVQFADSLRQTTERFSYPARLKSMLEDFKRDTSP